MKIKKKLMGGLAVAVTAVAIPFAVLKLKPNTNDYFNDLFGDDLANYRLKCVPGEHSQEVCEKATWTLIYNYSTGLDDDILKGNPITEKCAAFAPDRSTENFANMHICTEAMEKAYPDVLQVQSLGHIWFAINGRRLESQQAEYNESNISTGQHLKLP